MSYYLGLISASILSATFAAEPAAPQAPAPESSGSISPTTGPAPTDPSLEADIALIHKLEAITISLPPKEMTLDELAPLIQATADVSLVADWSALAAIGVAQDDEMLTGFTDTPVLGALDSIAQLCGDPVERARLEIHGGRAIITTDSGMKSLRSTRLYSAGEMASIWYEMILNHVDPSGWVDAGGSRGEAEVRDGSILVTASSRAHARISSLIAEWRRTHPQSVTVALFLIRAPAGSIAPASTPKGDLPPQWDLLAAPSVAVKMGDQATLDIDDQFLKLHIKLEPQLTADGSGISIKRTVRVELHESSVKLDDTAQFPFEGGHSSTTTPTGTKSLMLLWQATPAG